MRRQLHNSDVTFLVPNCIGGILFHDLGLQFRSPTVNLMMTQTDFVRFVLNLKDYLAQELEFFKHSEYVCPCAHLADVDVHLHTMTRRKPQLKNGTNGSTGSTGTICSFSARSVTV